MSNDPRMYSIPDKFRRIENLHIVFWLIKDLSWAMLWKPLGIIMVVPTVIAGLFITWQTRQIKSELFHNLAVVFWIFANAYWMIIEFWEFPDQYRYYTAFPFTIGIAFILSYYFIVLPAERRRGRKT
jgi:hypothetical protein